MIRTVPQAPYNVRMESSGSSFIPKRPTQKKPVAKSFRKIYVLSYVSYLVFFTTLLAAGGVFLYQLSLTSELNGLKEDLVAQRDQFNQADLDRVRNLDYRIDAARQLVNNHASLLTVLNALDETIADPVQLLSFNYNRTEDPRRPRLALSAIASQFDEVIFQERVLSGNAVTSNFAVADVNLSTQPIDPEQLELGVEQVVNINLAAELAVSDINFTGFPSDGAEGGALPEQSEAAAVNDADTDAADGSTDDGTNDTANDSEIESAAASDTSAGAAAATDGGGTAASGGATGEAADATDDGNDATQF